MKTNESTVLPRVGVVTGGNRGIGREIGRQLVARGLQVVLTSRQSAAGEAACREINAAAGAGGGRATPFRLEVTAAADIRALAAHVAATFGRLDVLVNNAGIQIDPKGSRALTSDLQTYRDSFETNVLAPLALIQALLPLMKKNGYGRIVNVSSGLGQLAEMTSGTPAYRMSKTALNALTRLVAAETRGGNILVNSMSPGWVRSDMGGPHAPRSLEQGADTAVWLATLPDGGPSGGFYYDRAAIAW
jgi:NAD(P)-dependent dehydrogenase (short-subunit alcohol dehydrogenase family)